MQHKPYPATRIKTRNYLSNITCNSIVREKFYNRNFVFDIYVLLTENLNPFSLEQKIAKQNKQKMIYSLWKECMLVEFYRFIFQEEHFLYLKGKNVFHSKFSDMV